MLLAPMNDQAKLSEMQIEESWKRFHQQLLAFIRQRVDQEHDAEDILSVVFLRLLQKGDDITNLRAWLYRSTRNAIIDYYRTKKQQEPIEQHESFAEPSREEDEYMACCIQQLVQFLPERDRLALVAISEGQSQEFYAAEQGLSSSGARSRIQRARQRVREAFVQYCRPERDVCGSIIRVNPIGLDCSDGSCGG